MRMGRRQTGIAIADRCVRNMLVRGSKGNKIHKYRDFVAMKTFFAFILAVALGIALGVATALLRIAQSPWDGNPPVSDSRAPVNTTQSK